MNYSYAQQHVDALREAWRNPPPKPPAQPAAASSASARRTMRVAPTAR
jgi:hypothetical protein